VRVGNRAGRTFSRLRSVLWLLGLGGLLVTGLFTSTNVPALPKALRPSTTGETLLTLQVDMEFADYNVLLAQREQALAEGVVRGGSDDFLPAVLRVGDEAASVHLRLMEGPAVGLDPDGKWPFAVRVQDDATLLGLQRFYLQDPEYIGGEARVALSRALEREEVLAARVRFVQLVFNGDDRGVYALQEGFADALLEAQERPRGVIVGFDADPFWQQVVHFDGDVEAALADPVLDLAGLHYLEVDAFDDPTIDRDPLLRQQRDDALFLLHALQAGTLPAGEVLDVERYARFLALVDLWGMPELASPLNMGFHLESEVGRLEPVAFASNLPESAWSSEGGRLSPAVTYGDPQLQMAYAREAARVSDPAYLEALRVAFGADVDAALWEHLAERQKLVWRSLNPVRPVFAYLAESTPESYGVLRVGVANVMRLSVEVVGFDVDGLTFVAIDPAWLRDGQAERVAEAEGVVLRARAPGDDLRYVHFDVPLVVVAQDRELDPHGDFEVSVVVRVAGVGEAQLTPARPGLPSLLEEQE
jgi:hypothetical protein